VNKKEKRAFQCLVEVMKQKSEKGKRKASGRVPIARGLVLALDKSISRSLLDRVTRNAAHKDAEKALDAAILVYDKAEAKRAKKALELSTTGIDTPCGGQTGP